MADEAKWYVVHTYSGYENKVSGRFRYFRLHHEIHQEIIEEKIRKCEKIPNFHMKFLIHDNIFQFFFENTQ